MRRPLDLRLHSFPFLLPALLLAASAASGCASIRLGEEQSAYYGAELVPYRYPQSCDDAWPEVLKLLGSKGYPLQGRDRQYAGEGKESGFASFADQGYETRAVEGGGLVVKTGWAADDVGRSRYQVAGNPGTPSGCVVRFTRISMGSVDPASEQQVGDWRMQLDLLKALDPPAAARVQAGAPRS